MLIRRAEQKDMPGINNLLCQVLMVHHNGRPDLFKANAKKYTDEQLAELIKDDKKPIFVYVDEAETVLGLKSPTSNILFLTVVGGTAIFFVVKAIIKIVRRVRFEKNPQLFYKPTIYDQNSEDDGY